MKITLLILTLITVGMLFVGCDMSPKKVQDAKDDATNTIDNVAELNKQLNDSIQQFKQGSEEKIDEYQKEIAELKTKLKTKKKATRVRFEKKIDDLNTKTNELKSKLNDYKEEGQEKWNSFKSEFNHDLEELGKAFKDVTVDNVK